MSSCDRQVFEFRCNITNITFCSLLCRQVIRLRMSAAESSSDQAKNAAKVRNSSTQIEDLVIKLGTFYKEEQFFDVTIICGTDEVAVPAHRIILSASSDFFCASFRSNLDKGNSDKIKLSEIDGSTMKSILDFMYTGYIELHPETVVGLLKAGDFLQINSLIVECSEFLSSQIDDSNCLGIALTAELYRLDDLYKKASLYATTNFSKVSTEKEFFSLNGDQLKQFLPDVDDAMADIVFIGLINWVNHDKENRKKSMLDIFRLVKFQFLTPKFILQNRKIVCEADGGNELILSWLDWHFSERSTEQPPPTASQSEMECSSLIVMDKKLIIFGCSASTDINSIKCYDMETKQWTELPPMLVGRRSPGITQLRGYLYVVGGANKNNEWICEAERYDFISRRWDRLPNLRSPIRHVQLYAQKDMLYAIDRDNNMQFYNRSVWVSGFSISKLCECYGVSGNKLFTFSNAAYDARQIYEVKDDYMTVRGMRPRQIVFRDERRRKLHFYNEGVWSSLSLGYHLIVC